MVVFSIGRSPLLRYCLSERLEEVCNIRLSFLPVGGHCKDMNYAILQIYEAASMTNRAPQRQALVASASSTPPTGHPGISQGHFSIGDYHVIKYGYLQANALDRSNV